MKKRLSSNVTRIIFTLFIIWTIISLFIVYRDIKNTIAVRFVIGYVIFTLFLLIYIPFSIILNLKKLNRGEIRKSIIRFIIIFLVFGTLDYVSDYVFTPSKVDLAQDFSIAFGLALGGSFFDLIFSKSKKTEMV